MRESLYRGKTSSGEWVYGLCLPYSICCDVGYSNEKGEFVSMEASYGDTLTILTDDKAQGELVQHNVLPETVGRDTGVNDTGKNKIFEGDIVQLTHSVFPDLADSVQVVKWAKEGAFYVEGQRSRHPLTAHQISLKIIGNIHDNPELLEEAK